MDHSQHSADAGKEEQYFTLLQAHSAIFATSITGTQSYPIETADTCKTYFTLGGDQIAHYQHGRRYNPTGLDTDENLSLGWHDRDMVSRRYGGADGPRPSNWSGARGKHIHPRDERGEFLGLPPPSAPSSTGEHSRGEFGSSREGSPDSDESSQDKGSIAR